MKSPEGVRQARNRRVTLTHGARERGSGPPGWIEGRCGRGDGGTRGPTGASGCPPRPGEGIDGSRARGYPRLSAAQIGRPAPTAFPWGEQRGSRGVHPVWWWGEYDGGFVRGCYTFQGLAGGVAAVNYAGCQTYISEFECMNFGMLVSSCPQIKFRLSLFHLSFPTGRSLKKCIM